MFCSRKNEQTVNVLEHEKWTSSDSRIIFFPRRFVIVTDFINLVSSCYHYEYIYIYRFVIASLKFMTKTKISCLKHWKWNVCYFTHFVSLLPSVWMYSRPKIIGNTPHTLIFNLQIVPEEKRRKKNGTRHSTGDYVFLQFMLKNEILGDSLHVVIASNSQIFNTSTLFWFL